MALCPVDYAAYLCRQNKLFGRYLVFHNYPGLVCDSQSEPQDIVSSQYPEGEERQRLSQLDKYSHCRHHAVIFG
jgi:hypothetical protein